MTIQSIKKIAVISTLSLARSLSTLMPQSESHLSRNWSAWDSLPAAVTAP